VSEFHKKLPLRLNKQDGGNRKFILIQLPEQVQTKTSASYDEKPTFLVYTQHKNDNLYDMGKLVADIVKQLPHPHVNQHYKQSSTNYTLIQAIKWWISSTSSSLQGGEDRAGGESRQQQRKSIDIQFNISSLLKSEGVYTIVVYLKHNNNYDTFPVTSYSIFSSANTGVKR
jgi:hypothetical protein